MLNFHYIKLVAL